jgi:hypothetical protein
VGEDLFIKSNSYNQDTKLIFYGQQRITIYTESDNVPGGFKVNSQGMIYIPGKIIL